MREDWPACERGQWRRVELARYLIDYGGGRTDRMSFDRQGRVADFGLAEARLKEIVETGKPFRTSGCPGKEDDVSSCNRPYGDSAPSDILSFPFGPDTEDLRTICAQLNEIKE